MAKAHDLAKRQREISIAEFFEKNRHLLGFDNKRKALLTTIKEAVDNSLDACEEGRMLPDINVEINQLGDFKYSIVVEDNGPGILKSQIPKVFAKLLYGSKFFKLSQSLAGDEKIIARIDGKVRILPIGELIDGRIKGEGEVPAGNLEVPAFDWKKHKYSFSKAATLIKHKRQHDMYRISTEYGRSVKVTGCHSLFTLDKELNVKEVEAKDIKKGDFIVAPKAIPHEGSLKSVNVLDYLSSGESKKKAGIPAVWPLTSAFMRFLGLYAARGQAGGRQIGFDFGIQERDLAEEAAGFAERMGASSEIEEMPESLRVNVSGSLLEVLMPKWCGKDAPEKSVPDFVFEAGSGLRQDFIDALCQGGGHMSENCLSHSTLSENLATQLNYLWLMNGATASTKTVLKKGRYPVREFVTSVHRSDLEVSKIFRPKNAQMENDALPSKLLRDLLPSSNSSAGMSAFDILEKMNPEASEEQRLCQLEVLTNGTPGKAYSAEELRSVSLENVDDRAINDLEKKGYLKSSGSGLLLTEKARKLCGVLKRLSVLRDSDIRLLEVADSERITDGYEYVYDISVPEKENFVASGLSCHNSRGQQGIGISAAVLYAQLTTGKPAKITSRISAKEPAHYYELHIDVKKNSPEILREEKTDWKKEHGTRIELTLEADYIQGKQSVDEYIRQTAIINPHVNLNYTNPKAEPFVYTRGAEDLPPLPKEIKPHPYGVEIGLLMRILDGTDARTLKSFLMTEFSRVGGGTAEEICQKASLFPKMKPRDLTRDDAEKLMKAMQPLGKEEIEKLLRKQLDNCVVGNLIKAEEADSLMKAMQPLGKEEIEKLLRKQLDKSKDLAKNLISRDVAETLINAVKQNEIKITAPPTDCISPIGKELLKKGLEKEVDAEFCEPTSRRAVVYRGNPFVVEVAIAYGGTIPKDKQISLMRFANRVPLLYQQGACAVSEALTDINWKTYGLQQSGSSVPVGPAVIVVHMASVWVPFTSEAKEAIAHYPEIIKEIKFALQECGRKLGMHVNKKNRFYDQLKRAETIENYIPEVAGSLAELTGIGREALVKQLSNMLNTAEIREQLELLSDSKENGKKEVDEKTD